MNELLSPPLKSILFENDKIIVCLAEYPLTPGHTIIIWKKRVTDLCYLSPPDYSYLMSVVDKVRNELLKALRVEKVYLIYMDETKQVHWHLVPRYNKKGFNLLRHIPKKISDFSIAKKIKIQGLS